MATGSKPKPARAAQSFHLRMWPEFHPDGESPALWRGSLCRMDGSGQRYFASWEQLAAIIGELSGAELPLDSFGRAIAAPQQHWGQK